jgi:hypothetical protein
VGQWQPHGADLLPSRKQAVEDAPRDDEVGTRVVMAEGQTGVRVVNRGRAAGNCDKPGDQERDAAGTI